MNTRNRRSALAILFVVLGCWFVQQPGSAAETSTALTPLSVSTDTGEKPQSKVWFHRGTWWAVLPSTSPSGTWVWRLNPNNSWSNVLQLSARTDVKADVKNTGAVTHVLLYSASSPGATELASIEYVASGNTYQLWSGRTLNTPIALPASSETATIDTDSSGRLWLATKAITSVVVYYSDAPYTVMNGPVTLETGINADDISLVTALPNNKVGVLWSNQQTKRFGFRVHADGADPGTWSADELPASQSAQDIGLGMADDHMNVAVAADGTLYAAVKTSYDTGGSTKIALLVRRPTGVWDNLYHVDVNGTRPIVLLDELTAKVRVVYSSSESGPDIVYKESSISAIDFSGPAQLLMSGSGGALNNATSTKQNWTGRVVVLASTASAARGVLISREDPTLAGYWPMNDGSGALARDHSGFGSDGILQGNAAWIAGVNGAAVDLDGTGDYVLVPESRNLDITAAITMAAWVKPERQATQDLIKKATVGTVDGYELSLATATSTGKAFVRFNQATSGDTYRLDALNLYPSDGNTWIHLAATYDGAIMRLYVNGVLQGEKAGPTAIASNALSVGIGAQPSDGTRALMGQLDGVRIYNRALNATEIATLAEASLEADLSITKSNGQSSVTAGQPVSYTIVATNNGPAPVTGATVTDTPPAALTGATWTCSASAASSCPASGTGSLAAQVNLAAGGTATFTLNATVAAGASGSVANTASVAAPSGISDPTGSNNSATDTDTVLAAPTPGLSAGLAGYWKMDEGTGTTLVDVSGNANNATTVGGPTWETGKDGLALTLNGSTQYATAAHNSTLNITGPMTMAGWVKTSAVATQNLIKKATGSVATTGGYELSLSMPGKAFVRLSDAAAVYRVDSVTSYPIGTHGFT